MASRRIIPTKQQIRKEIVKELNELQEVAEEAAAEAAAEAEAEEEIFKMLCGMYGFTGKYNADVWDGRISYIAEESF